MTDARSRESRASRDIRRLLEAPVGFPSHADWIFRGNLRKARNRLQALGARVQFLSAHRPDELPAAFARFLAVEASGWKGQHGTESAIGLSRLRIFRGELVERLGPFGACGTHPLLLDGPPIAGQFSILAGDRCYHRDGRAGDCQIRAETSSLPGA